MTSKRAKVTLRTALAALSLLLVVIAGISGLLSCRSVTAVSDVYSKEETPIVAISSGRLSSPATPLCEEVTLEDKVFLGQVERELWARTVHRYLKDDLWTDLNAYDAGHYLMVPLHAAFWLDEDIWQQEFAEYFRSFVHAISIEPEAFTANRLARLQHLYLASRFAVTVEKAGKGHLVSPDLVALLYDEIQRLWSVEPAWQWARDPFKGGIRERLAWKLKTDDTKLERSYYRAIIDEEFFLIAIAADLRAYERLTKTEHHYSETIDEVLNVAKTIFEQEIVQQCGGGWLLQPGVWTDHPDYAYVGNDDKHPGMQPAPVPGIAMDSSHSHRFPLWLTSLSDAYEDGSPEKDFYVSLKQGLEKQLFNKVLVMPTSDFPAVRLTNFMDGSNGVYRWGYPTQGEGRGYGLYELSGTLTLGWWSFLGSQCIADIYGELSEQFPLPQKVIDVYVGPNTLRERHSLVSDPGRYYNGFGELVVHLAAALGELE